MERNWWPLESVQYGPFCFLRIWTMQWLHLFFQSCSSSAVSLTVFLKQVAKRESPSFTQQKLSYTICVVIFLLYKSSLKILCLVLHIHIRCHIYCINISIISSLHHIIDRITTSLAKRHYLIFAINSLLRWWLPVGLFNDACSTVQYIIGL